MATKADLNELKGLINNGQKTTTNMLGKLSSDFTEFKTFVDSRFD
jgi:hypothetical protein